MMKEFDQKYNEETDGSVPSSIESGLGLASSWCLFFFFFLDLEIDLLLVAKAPPLKVSLLPFTLSYGSDISA